MLLRPPPKYKSVPATGLDKTFPSTKAPDGVPVEMAAGDTRHSAGCESTSPTSVAGGKLDAERCSSKCLATDEIKRTAVLKPSLERRRSCNSVTPVPEKSDKNANICGNAQTTVYNISDSETDNQAGGYREILTTLPFLRLLLMTGLGAFSAFGIRNILPSLALEWGASDMTASLAVTTLGATEIVTR